MTTTPDSVVRQLTLELISSTERSSPLDAELRYDPRDPYAVSLVLRTGSAPVTWIFGRGLLSAGLDEPTGDGDVHVWPCVDLCGRRVVMIEFRSPDGRALLQAPVGAVADFVESTHRAVAPGCESDYVDMGAMITAILAAGAR